MDANFQNKKSYINSACGSKSSKQTAFGVNFRILGHFEMCTSESSKMNNVKPILPVQANHLKFSLLLGLTLTSIFFFDLVIDIIYFDSNNFNAILENCKKHEIIIIFTCIPLYFCCYDSKIPQIQSFFIIFELKLKFLFKILISVG